MYRTTALCAIPVSHPRRFRALEAARESLRISRDISKRYVDNAYTWTACCHWALLRTPLTPFTGVFNHVVANPQTSREDLQLLDDFVASLQLACKLSEGVERLYQLCSVFVKVARAYVRAKTQHHITRNNDMSPWIPSQALQPVIGEFDEHLSALGLLGPPTTTNNDSACTDAVVNDPEQQSLDMTSPQDWYSGNVSMYSLLELEFNELNEMDVDYCIGGTGDG